MSGFFGDLSVNRQNCPQITDAAIKDSLTAPFSAGSGPAEQACATGTHSKAESG